MMFKLYEEQPVAELVEVPAHLLSMTLSERWGRLFVSVNYAVRTSTPQSVAKPDRRAGVDLGLRTCGSRRR